MAMNCSFWSTTLLAARRNSFFILGERRCAAFLAFKQFKSHYAVINYHGKVYCNDHHYNKGT